MKRSNNTAYWYIVLRSTGIFFITTKMLEILIFRHVDYVDGQRFKPSLIATHPKKYAHRHTYQHLGGCILLYFYEGRFSLPLVRENGEGCCVRDNHNDNITTLTLTLRQSDLINHRLL